MESLEHDHVKDGNIPIAVIGYSFKFPQEATSFQDFWRMLVEGRSARTEVPGERFNIDAYYHSDGNRLEGVRKSWSDRTMGFDLILTDD